jgi:large subunit ribosomal protein L30
MAKKIKITQIRSTIGRLENQKRTMVALGIRKIGQSVVHEKSPAIEGMVNTVKHLVAIEEVNGDAE